MWSSLWDDHPGLPKWNLKPGDMFIMWAQQWRYISRAMELGYRVMRADTDVYFAEDPYPIFHSPLFKPFEMIVQHDFEGRARPRCTATPRGGSAVAPGLQTCGAVDRGQALLNIGLVYLRSRPGGGVFAVINGTWGRFHKRLGEAPWRPPHLNGKVESQALIDQPFMRSVANDIAIADRTAHPAKSLTQWSVVPSRAAAAYPKGSRCARERKAECAAVAKARDRSEFLVQLVRPPRGGGASPRDERIALAPDWLFGRGCLTHVRQPIELIRSAIPGWSPARVPAGSDGPNSCAATARGALVPFAPAHAAGVLVATHFVYSMALKRKRAFRAFGWDLADQRNRSTGGQAPCWDRSDRGVVLGHTFFTQTKRKAVVCALPPSEEPTCSCCASVPTVVPGGPAGGKGKGGGRRVGVGGGRFSIESTSGFRVRDNGVLPALEGCNDYQLFWD